VSAYSIALFLHVAGVLALFASIGIAVTRRRVVAIAAALPTADGPIPSPVADRLRDPALRASAALRAALGVGIVFDMVVKPGTTVAVAALIVALVVGAAALLAGEVGGRSAVVANE
jgi:hypothetical protein